MPNNHGGAMTKTRKKKDTSRDLVSKIKYGRSRVKNASFAIGMLIMNPKSANERKKYQIFLEARRLLPTSPPP